MTVALTQDANVAVHKSVVLDQPTTHGIVETAGNSHLTFVILIVLTGVMM